MDKQHIITELIHHHDAFISKLKALSDSDFEENSKGKWTAGQQLDHVIKSVKLVDMAFGLPMFVLKMKFGTTNRPSKTYADIVKDYLKKLDDNKDHELADRFVPDQIPVKAKLKKLNYLEELVTKLTSRLSSRYTEEDLDNYVLQHPLLGKLTLREVLYFIIYHVQHHDKQILKNLNQAV